jgi:pseudaminic acid cytidylyltransferase
LRVAIIPARGGSKRVPRKNILPLNGTPLLSYTIRAAMESNCFDRVIVSTEDEEIAKLAEKEGVEVDRRPQTMAGDTVTKVQVVFEFLNRPENQGVFSEVCALLPTCPFRQPSDIQNAIALFESRSEQFLIGTTAYDFPIQLALEPIENSSVMKPVFENGYAVTRSQDIKTTYHPNGAIYLAEVDAFLKKESFFNDEMICYEMPAVRSFDIDYPWQFELAEIIAQKKLYLSE